MLNLANKLIGSHAGGMILEVTHTDLIVSSDSTSVLNAGQGCYILTRQQNLNRDIRDKERGENYELDCF